MPTPSGSGSRRRRPARPWSEVAGIAFRRTAAQSAPIEGLWVRAEWRTAPGNDPRDTDSAEAALKSLTESSATLEIPFVGTLEVPRDRLRRLVSLGTCRRIVIDPSTHHLGDRVSKDFDPPQAEETPLEVPFALENVPSGEARLTLDVVQVVGLEGSPPFSELVKKGQLRTHVLVNGTRLDDLNDHVPARNETPHRVRLAIPSGVLKPKNLVRIVQDGTEKEPKLRDNMGLLGVGLEFGPEGPGKKASP